MPAVVVAVVLELLEELEVVVPLVAVPPAPLGRLGAELVSSKQLVAASATTTACEIDENRV